MTIRPVGIALGSNLGNRIDNLRQAVAALRVLLHGGGPFLTAPVYQTNPVNCPDGSPAFLNTVVEISSEADPLALLKHTRAIERSLGRTPGGVRNAPRTIDLDILYVGDLIVDEAELRIPHPRLAERRFVLQPLADIRPNLILPGLGETIAALLGRCAPEDEPPCRFADPL